MCNYHRPVCVKCRIDMRPEKNGVQFIEDDGNGSPYKLWAADKWKCPECGFQVLVGFGAGSYSGIWDENFEKQVAQVMELPDTVREKTKE